MTTSRPKIPDRYEILAELGSGGMGTVYKAHDSLLDSVVALKVLNLTGGTDPDKIMRFNNEARACGQLRHKNIVGILNFGYHENVTPYMVMEFVEGETLKKSAGKLSLEECNLVFIQIANALAHAHSQNIIHRDLKSDNILLARDDDDDGKLLVKLFDFGIARIIENENALKLTSTNAILGTPTTMSPEQARGQRADTRSDIYSFGCVMFETLTGRLPFSAQDVFGLLEKQMILEPPKIGSIVDKLGNSKIEAIVDRCLQKDPEDRFQSADEILQSLSTAATNPEKAVDETAHIHVASQNKISSKTKAILAVALLSVLLLATIFVIVYRNEPNEATVSNQQKNRNVQAVSKPKVKWRSGLDKDHPEILRLCQVKDFHESDIPDLPEDLGIKNLDVSLIEPKELSDQGFENVSRLNWLTDIEMRYFEHATTASIRSLSKLEHLAYLRAVSTEFEDSNSLRLLKHLKGLEISHFSPKQFQDLNSDGKLAIAHLNLTDSKLDKDMVHAICRIKTLEDLNLESSFKRDSSAIAEFRTLPKLRTLNLSDCAPLTNNEVRSIARIRQISHLELRKNKLTDAEVEQIATMTGLTELSLDANLKLTDKALSYLARMPYLKVLGIRGCVEVSKNAIDKFKKATKGRCSITADILPPPVFRTTSD